MKGNRQPSELTVYLGNPAACRIKRHFSWSERQDTMTLYGLQLLVSVAKEGSITKVSKMLRVSQPSVSQHLRRLQDEFGVVLFTKNKRGLELTEHGKVIINDVESITAQVDALRARCSATNAVQATGS